VRKFKIEFNQAELGIIMDLVNDKFPYFGRGSENERIKESIKKKIIEHVIWKRE
jgi:hypothetical protein